jgi:FkbM family methyltransferase
VSKRPGLDWNIVTTLLSNTIRSVLNQTDPDFIVLICSHDKPECAEMEDPRVKFIEATFPRALEPNQFVLDKMRKRRATGREVYKMGGGYVVMLDADDLVSRRLVAYFRQAEAPHGYTFPTGYAMDFATGALAPVPGAWSKPFTECSGSSGAIYFEREDFKEPPEPNTYFRQFRKHREWPAVAARHARPLSPVPFPAAVAVLNTQTNISFVLRRPEERVKALLSKIDRLSIPITPALIEEFSLPLAAIRGKAKAGSNSFADDIAASMPGYDIRIVFDVGANVGQSLRRCLRLWPGASVWCFEPVAETFRKLQTSIPHNDQVFFVNTALGDYDGVARMRARSSSLTNRLLRSDERDDRTQDVQIARGDSFCRNNGIDHINFLKIDTEGNDLSVLHGFSEMIQTHKIDFIQVEAGMHPGNHTHVPLEQFKSFLESKGYSLFKFYGQTLEWNGPIKLRRTDPVFISETAACRGRSPQS